MPQLPTGTVTFLFTDIEGSTRLLADAGSDYAAAALAGAADMQRAFAGHPWPDGWQIRVRAGVHSGEVTLNEGGYVGMAIHEVARISAAGHGGQVLVSSTTRELAADARLAGVELRDLGEHRLKDVSHLVRLFQLAGDGLPDGFPPPRTLGSGHDNLPPPLTSFIGREEVAEGKRLLADTRLLTLTGPGGTGKTRLALQLAADAGADFPDGVFFVALESVRDADLVPSAIVTALGLPTVGAVSPVQRVVDHLRDRSSLIVLDNFEQVVEGASVVAQMVREAPRVK